MQAASVPSCAIGSILQNLLTSVFGNVLRGVVGSILGVYLECLVSILESQ